MQHVGRERGGSLLLTWVRNRCGRAAHGVPLRRNCLRRLDHCSGMTTAVPSTTVGGRELKEMRDSVARTGCSRAVLVSCWVWSAGFKPEKPGGKTMIWVGGTG